MNKKLTFLVFLFLTIILFSIGIFSKLKDTLNSQQKHWLKTNFFPYKYIDDLEKDIYDLNNKIYDLNNKIIVENYKFFNLLNEKDKLQQDLLNNELVQKENLNDIIFSYLEKVILNDRSDQSNHLTLLKYKNKGQISYGINNIFPGSGYIEIYKNKIWLLSSRGIIGFEDLKKKEFVFKQIENNLDVFLSFKEFNKNNWFSFKDLMIVDEKIFVSFTEEIYENCWNTSIVYGDLNYSFINFEYLFKAKECVSTMDNLDNEFNAHQSGGRIVNIGNNEILFSIGDYRSRYLAQDKESVNGKIIKINLINKSFDIVSMGHRNPQGLYYDKENNFILETEHGPSGGDEINIIYLNNDKIPNYGWPIASYGEHYGGRKPSNERKYKKYPLYKSHKDFGFIEPIKYLHIGISEITKIRDKIYVASSLGAQMLLIFSINEINSIKKIDNFKVYERVRDIKFYDNKLYLFLEDSPGIGIINLIDYKI